MGYLQWLIYTMLDSTRLLNVQKLTATSTAGSVKSLKWFLKNETSYNLIQKKINKNRWFLTRARKKKWSPTHRRTSLGSYFYFVLSFFSLKNKNVQGIFHVSLLFLVPKISFPGGGIGGLKIINWNVFCFFVCPQKKFND